MTQNRMGNKRSGIGTVGIKGAAKTILFNSIIVLLPFFLLFIVEVVLRIANYGDSYRLFVEFEHFGKTYKTANSDYGKKYFSQLNYTQPPNDIFLKEKPVDGYRIFVMGSSTVVGFPYNSSSAFSRILQQRLQDSYPNRYIEVVNIAITAINSYTLYDLTNQILEQQPDAILIYAGHNEFYGAMGVASIEGMSQFRGLKLTHLKLLNLRFYQWMNNIISGLKTSLMESSMDNEVKGKTLMESIALHKSIEYKGKIYQVAHDHYLKNMGSILRRATKKGVTVLFSEVVSNVRDLEPFVAVQSDVYPKADEVFAMARQQEKEGDVMKAKELYYQAKDLDGLRFRASDEINEIIHELCRQYEAVLVSMKSVFEEHSPDNLIGENLLTEHVHPNLEGYFLMADAFYSSLTKNKVIGDLDSINFRPNSYYMQNWGFTPLDSVFAQLRLQQLVTRWPFTKTSPNISFLDQYVPSNQLDSLALQILLGSISLGDAYRLMAAQFERSFQNLEAFQYVLALARMNPHNPVNFVKAGELMLSEGNYELATEMYLLSVRHNRQMNQIYKIGELFLRMNKPEMAAKYLTEAQQMASGDIKEWIGQLLSEIDNGINRFTVNHANITESSEFPGTADAQQKVVIFAPPVVTEKIAEARLLIRQQNLQEALQLLYQANEIYETPAANRYIGEILLSFNNREALDYFRKAYPEHRTHANYLATFCYAAIVFSETQLAQEMLKRLKILDPGNQNIRNFELKMGETTQNAQ